MQEGKLHTQTGRCAEEPGYGRPRLRSHTSVASPHAVRLPARHGKCVGLDRTDRTEGWKSRWQACCATASRWSGCHTAFYMAVESGRLGAGSGDRSREANTQRRAEKAPTTAGEAGWRRGASRHDTLWPPARGKAQIAWSAYYLWYANAPLLLPVVCSGAVNRFLRRKLSRRSGPSGRTSAGTRTRFAVLDDRACLCVGFHLVQSDPSADTHRVLRPSGNALAPRALKAQPDAGAEVVAHAA